ncbi:putative quinol monooxygenase [Flavobacterium sp. J27]|uniref:putative quinol monooxygenase n=1 Tax=Flavobacterium sp. J27 TaxID=2060419 RepID=UPI001031BB1C|nr:putative quinol monooxygenase [Flavobacterium sp. J27]
MKVYITVVLTAKDNTSEILKQQLLTLTAFSRKEAGCLQYDLHQNAKNSSVFVLHEVWENEAILEKHNHQKYVQAFFSLAPNLLEKDPEIIVTHPLA